MSLCSGVCPCDLRCTVLYDCEDECVWFEASWDRGQVRLSVEAAGCVCVSGVRMISLSYSRISLADIAQKLQLDSPEDAEFIVAKVRLAHTFI